MGGKCIEDLYKSKIPFEKGFSDVIKVLVFYLLYIQNADADGYHYYILLIHIIDMKLLGIVYHIDSSWNIRIL